MMMMMVMMMMIMMMMMMEGEEKEGRRTGIRKELTIHLGWRWRVGGRYGKEEEVQQAKGRRCSRISIRGYMRIGGTVRRGGGGGKAVVGCMRVGGRLEGEGDRGERQGKGSDDGNVGGRGKGWKGLVWKAFLVEEEEEKKSRTIAQEQMQQ